MWIKKTQALQMSDGSAENLGVASIPRFFDLLSEFGRLPNFASKAQVRNSSGVPSYLAVTCGFQAISRVIRLINNSDIDNLFQAFCY